MEANFPASPTAATLTAPSCPIMIWSTRLNDDCSSDCSAAGIASVQTVLKKRFSSCIPVPPFVFLSL